MDKNGLSFDADDEIFYASIFNQIAKGNMKTVNEKVEKPQISILEKANGCYVCLACPVKDGNAIFSTWSGNDFTAHLASCHKSTEEFACVYCNVFVKGKSLESHINHHMQQESFFIYSCWCCAFQTNSCRHFSAHMEGRHANELKEPIICPHCQISQVSLTAAMSHLSASSRVIVHCTATNCLVKSVSRQAVVDHAATCHPDMPLTLLTTTQILCTESDVRLPTTPILASSGLPIASRVNQLFPGRKLDPHFFSPTLPEPTVPTLTQLLKKSSYGESNGDRHVYCLRCPYCPLTTIRWDHFTRHQLTCPKCEKSDFLYRLYHCSICQAVSTERDIIKEHVLYEHDAPETAIVAEEVITNLIHPEPSSLTGVRKLMDTQKRALGSDSSTFFNNEQSAKRSRLDTSSDSSLNGRDEPVIPISSNGSDIVNGDCELVSLPFDEPLFRVDFMGRSDFNLLFEKMRRLSSYTVKILGKENHRRIPECPECGKIFPHGLGDFKRHLMSIHLEIPRDNIKECLRYTNLPKGEERFQELQEQLAMRNLKPHFIEPGKKKIPLPYSVGVLRSLIMNMNNETQEYLLQRMKIYASLFIILDTCDANRKYRCYHCSYSSPHALADVRKHILGAHCGISTKHFRFCLQASRLDPIEFTLLSEDKLVRLAKEFVKRKKRMNMGEELEHMSFNEFSADAYRTASFSQSSNQPSQDFNEDTKPILLDNGDIEEDSFTIPSISSKPSTSRRTEERRSLPILPRNSHPLTYGRKGTNSLLVEADSEVPLPLPFSEPVLRQLLAPHLSPEEIDDMVTKMDVYSQYSLTRLLRGRKTVAFACRCGRVFHASRIPGKTMRPATLADSRRHIMGVHARISHEYLTICCQASRISRENNYEIYPDSMLLRLATDRPIKPVVSTSSTTAAASESTSIEPVANNLQMPADYSFNSDDYVDSANNSADVKNEPLDIDDDIGIRPRKSAPPDVSASNNDDNMSDSESCERHLSRYNPLSNYNCEDPDTIERFIDLPYSLNALYKLTDGFCTESYLPILREKMDIYSSYKLYVVRRDGRRYFCCSGCPASSPHGMGDIRKHIFGVHAKVPERYKAAAMHCSRLSREDNGLLPDRVLLQLSKMRWKGTVIRPLSELSEGDLDIALSGGIQRRGTVQTAAVPKPFSSLSMVGRNGALLTRDVSPSADSDSNNVPIADDTGASSSQKVVVPSDMYIEKIIGKYGEQLFQCSVCKQTSPHPGSIRGHIVCDHLNIPRHRCLLCGELFNLKPEALEHHQKFHPSHTFRVCQHSPYRQAMSMVSFRKATRSKSTESRAGSNNDTNSHQDFDEDEDDDYIEDVEEKESSLTNDADHQDAVELDTNGKSSMMVVPLSLDQPLHPALLKDCYVERRKGGYGKVIFHCSVCSGSSSSLASIKSHIAQYHVGVYPYKCHLCATTFWKRDALMNHFDFNHPGEKPNPSAPADYRRVMNQLVVKTKSRQVAQLSGAALQKRQQKLAKMEAMDGEAISLDDADDNNEDEEALAATTEKLDTTNGANIKMDY